MENYIYLVICRDFKDNNQKVVTAFSLEKEAEDYAAERNSCGCTDCYFDVMKVAVGYFNPAEEYENDYYVFEVRETFGGDYVLGDMIYKYPVTSMKENALMYVNGVLCFGVKLGKNIEYGQKNTAQLIFDDEKNSLVMPSKFDLKD